MKSSFVQILACRHCQSSVQIRETRLRTETEIIDGSLECTVCGDVMNIQRGVPVALKREDYLDHVAKSFGFEWQLHHDGGFETETVFGRSLDEDVEYFLEAFGLNPTEMRNLLVLDAGCGSGTLTVELAKRFPDCQFVGLDFNPAIYEIFRKHGSLPNLHLVRSSVFTIPFRNGTFDLAWSNGVIHHTGDTRKAFNSVTRTVRFGGMAYLWVYERKMSPLVALRKLLTPIGLEYWNHNFLYQFCRLISIPTWIGVSIISSLGGLSLVKRNVHLKILTKKRGYKELVLTWFDVLSPRYRDTYSKGEFEAWFVEAGFERLKHYWWPVGVCGVKRQAVMNID